MKKAHCKNPGRSFNGIRAPGIEISLPLSSRHILVMLERSYFGRMQWIHGRAEPMDPIGVEHFNTLQVMKCHRQVYCEADEFEQAVGLCQRYPELCVPKRARVQGTQTDDLLSVLFFD